MTRSTKAGPARGLPVAILAVIAAAAPAAQADSVTPPPVPAAIAVTDGSRPYLVVHAVGTQNQVCLPRAAAPGLAWTFHGPQATLFDDRDRQLLTHFLGANPSEEGQARPAWQSSRDSSAVWARPVASSTDPDHVAAGAIPWLLLRVAGAEAGPDGGDVLTETTWIQRVNTSGGLTPAGDCPAVGAKLFVPYTADYVFYWGRR